MYESFWERDERRRQETMDQETLNKIDANIAICRGKRIESKEGHARFVNPKTVGGADFDCYDLHRAASNELRILQLLRLGVLVGMGQLRIDDAITQVLSGGEV